MKEFVVVYAFAVDDPQHIPMVLKNKPAHLKGLLNLPGGSIESGETPIDAAIRELKEETGLEELGVTDGMCPVGPELMGEIVGNESVIHCVLVPITFRQELKPREGETEEFAWYDVIALEGDRRLVPNLRLIIPLMQSGAKGWRVTDYHDWRGYYHTLGFYPNTKNWLTFEPLKVTVPGLEFYDDLRPEYDLTKLVPRKKNECQ